MKVYSKVITRAALVDALRESNPQGDITIDSLREFRPRNGGNGFELYLEGWGERHRRARNGREGKAATWDDYGNWFALLFKLDPAARISFYNGVGEFLDHTSRYTQRGAKAPWLHTPIYFELSKLAAREFERVRALEVA